jgi:hypothetical protein
MRVSHRILPSGATGMNGLFCKTIAWRVSPPVARAQWTQEALRNVAKHLHVATREAEGALHASAPGQLAAKNRKPR